MGMPYASPIVLQDSSSISQADLYHRLGTPRFPVVIDVRRRPAIETAPQLIPASVWCEPTQVHAWMDALDRRADIVITCAHAHNLSQGVAAMLRAAGYRARHLEGGIAAWRAAGWPTIMAASAEALPCPSLWVTRARPKIDRIACAWLIRRFVDPAARFLYVESEHVAAVAEDTGAIPFDIPGVKLTHDGDRCSFDALLAHFGLTDDPALCDMATVIRGADTGVLDLVPEAAGLAALAIGLTASEPDDLALLERGFALYDALHGWARHARAERHGWTPQTAPQAPTHPQAARP